MSVAVGQFPGIQDLNRRMHRGLVNPTDLSTIISIFPKEMRIEKITLIPGRWTIPAGSIEKPSILIVGPSSWWKEDFQNGSLLEVSQGSSQIAESIVKDYCNGIFGCDMAESCPGIFWVPGKHTIESIKKEFPELFEKAIRGQTGYYRTMIKAADHLWAGSGGSTLVINDEMRMAARILGLEDKDWMRDSQAYQMVRCFACGTLKNPGFAVCAACSAIDPNHPMAKEIKFAPKNLDLR